MKIGILQTGRSPDEIIETHGDYDALFRELLAGRGFEFFTCKVLDGEIPDSVTAADGWLITGSRFGAYEDHAWIPPFEEFLRAAYAEGVPIVGICFGHQILAQALGGKVEKFDGGWSVGPVSYDVEGRSLPLMAWHQDQITVLPDGAEVIGSSDFCRYAFLRYGDRALSCQPHPEFSPSFFKALLEARKSVLPADVAAKAHQIADQPLARREMAGLIADFFHAERDRRH